MKRMLIIPILCAAIASIAGVADQARVTKIDPVRPGELRIEPMFSSAGLTYGAASTEGLRIAFRKKPEGRQDVYKEAEWAYAEDPRWFDEVSNYRGMIWGLHEDAAYEVEIRICAADGRVAEVPARGEFRTWKSDVPIARTVEINPATVSFPMVISDQGTPDGWIRYTIKDRQVLRAQVTPDSTLFCVSDAAYILLDDMRVEAPGARTVVQVEKSRGVRIRNCDISRYGLLGECRLDLCGHYVTGWDKSRNRPRGNGAAAVRIGRGASEVVVERCFVHDPGGRSTVWRHSHPTGPMAVVVDGPSHSTVIRHNDFVGSDEHRWDDAVGGARNFEPDGGFNRTAEIYGNFMAFANDDAIELDGGQQNLLCRGNRFEGCLVGVSIQGNLVSPSYVLVNLFSGMDDEKGEFGQTVKTSGFDLFGQGPYSLVRGNVFWGRGTGLNAGVQMISDPNHRRSDAGRQARIDVIDNVFCGLQRLEGEGRTPDAVFRGNRHRVRRMASELDARIPRRPLPFLLDAVRLDVGSDHAPRQVKVVGGDGIPFEVRKCSAFDWFDVEPSAGVLHDGMTLTIRFHEDRMTSGPVFRGAFLVRSEDGLSRPVSVYATTGWRQPERCERPGDVAVYAHPQDAVRDAEGFDVYAFDAPRDARYYFLAFAQADRWPNALVAVDADEPEKTLVQTAVDSPVWSILAPGRPKWSVRPGRIRSYDLKAGPHRLRMRMPEGVRLSSLVMTDNPLSFEPKVARGFMPADPLDAFVRWPEGKDPKTVATRVVEQFARGLETFGPTNDWRYHPVGYAGNRGYGALGKINGLHYPVVLLWAQSVECARKTGNRPLLAMMLEKFRYFHDQRRGWVAPPYHVDMTIFGLLPLKAYEAGEDRRALVLGLAAADQQWAKPSSSDFEKLTENVVAQNFPLERQLELWKDGYTPQTRLWIDDMFMITAIQAEAYRVTGNRKYIDRCAREMVLYLDELQIKEGPDRGLFYHAPDTPYLWARGNGWMAAGFALLLRDLPADNPHRGRILRGYRLMMAALRRTQRTSDGLWDELVGDRRSWPETSGSAMFAFAFVEGLKNGWLGEEYAPLARRAYLSLVDMLDEHGNVRNVCEGTAKRNDYQYYIDRRKVTGDPHGQAPLLWVCDSLMSVQKDKEGQ